MKTDRFTKVLLIAIAVLLAINCARDTSRSGGDFSVPFFEKAVKASPPPAFIQVDKFYFFGLAMSAADTPLTVKGKVKQIDKDSGWVRVILPGDRNVELTNDESKLDAYVWVNLGQVARCYELDVEPPKSKGNQ